jgi:hypothetical protein
MRSDLAEDRHIPFLERAAVREGAGVPRWRGFPRSYPATTVRERECLCRGHPPSLTVAARRGTAAERSKDQFPWFGIGDTFKGDRLNDLHVTHAEKQATRSRSTAPA